MFELKSSALKVEVARRPLRPVVEQAAAHAKLRRVLVVAERVERVVDRHRRVVGVAAPLRVELAVREDQLHADVAAERPIHRRARAPVPHVVHVRRLDAAVEVRVVVETRVVRALVRAAGTARPRECPRSAARPGCSTACRAVVFGFAAVSRSYGFSESSSVTSAAMLISNLSLAMKRSTPRAAWTFSSPSVPTMQPLLVPFSEVRCGKANLLSAALPTTPMIGVPRPPTPAIVLFGVGARRAVRDPRPADDAVVVARELRRAVRDHLAREVDVVLPAVALLRDVRDAREQLVLDQRRAPNEPRTSSRS